MDFECKINNFLNLDNSGLVVVDMQSKYVLHTFIEERDRIIPNQLKTIELFKKLNRPIFIVEYTNKEGMKNSEDDHQL
jgi:nicotinamidase-related amidase